MNNRKFTLTNAEGTVWEFTNKQIKSFLTNPKNLGFERKLETERYGENSKVVSSKFEFPKPSGEILFTDSKNADRYEKYYAFCRFLMNEPLVLEYTLPFSEPVSYYLECCVTKLAKTESEKNILKCEIELQGLGFWKGNPVTITGTGYTYTVTNDSDFPVGFKINVQGALLAPYIDLKQNGEVYGEAKFDVQPRYSQIMIDSRDGMQDIQIGVRGSVMPNPLSYQDLSISNGSIYVTFMKLARGTSVIEIKGSSLTISSCVIEFSPIYRSV